MLAKKQAVLYSCLKQGETEFQSNGQNYLIEEISRQHTILSMVWLSLTSFTQISAREEHRVDKKDAEMCSWNMWAVEDKDTVYSGKASTIVTEISAIERNS